MDKKTFALILVAAVVIIALYLFTKDKTVANTEETGDSTPGPAAPISSSGTSTTVSEPLTAGKASQTLTQSTTATGAPSSTQDAAIQNWFNGLSVGNKAQAFKMLSSMTAAEKASLYDIIINEWQNGGPATQARVNFWNTWRIKYHILDGTYA